MDLIFFFFKFYVKSFYLMINIFFGGESILDLLLESKRGQDFRESQYLTMSGRGVDHFSTTGVAIKNEILQKPKTKKRKKKAENRVGLKNSWTKSSKLFSPNLSP